MAAQLKRAAWWLLLSLVVALLAGSASAWLLLALDWATQTREAHRWLLWLLPLAGFAVGWVYLKLGQDVEAGNRLLIDEIHQPRRIIPLRMAPFILVSTTISHLFGASVGREGTALQMGGALADQLSRAFHLQEADRRIVLMAGISAGFASVFGTPWAGAVFGLEVLTVGSLRWRAALPCVVAALLADQVCLLWGAHHTTFGAGAMPLLAGGTLAAAAAAGVAFGFTGQVFVRSTHALTAFMKQRIAYAPLRPLLGGVVLALAIVGLDAWRYAGLGIPTIEAAFQQPLAPWDFAAKAVFTTVSLGTGFKGGEVTPLFFIGATLGNALAPLLHQPLAWLAALGFVGVFAGAARTPVACTVMAMELFGPQIGLYAALACAASWACAGRTGLYSPAPRRS